MIRDLIALENTSKVWVYQASRDFTYDELDEARPLIFDFLDSWTSHNQDLLTYGNIFHRRFLALFVDESHATASGCSIDKSVHFVTELGNQFGVNFFDRETIAYMIDEEIYFCPLSSLKDLYKEGTINDGTLMFNHLVTTKGDFLKKWIIPLNESWYKRFV
jgi:hypothetical protein